MDFRDDELKHFEARGADLPKGGAGAYVDNDGAHIWHASFGAGAPVILLHGGLGHSGNWGHQIQPLVDAGHQVVVIDSRGHGRSSRDSRPYSYELMATDVFAVMDALGLNKAAIVGWSDGACIGMIMADKAPERVSGVFFFACNMDPNGALPFEATPVIDRCFGRHVKDYARLSATPDGFSAFADAVGLMQRTQPNYTADDLARIGCRSPSYRGRRRSSSGGITPNISPAAFPAPCWRSFPVSAISRRYSGRNCSTAQC